MNQYKRPPYLVAIAALYVVSPVLNIGFEAAGMLSRDVPTEELGSHLVRSFGAVGLLLIALGPFIGVGIYSGRRFGLIGFVSHAVAVLAFNFYVLASNSKASVASIIVTDVLLFAAVAFLLRKDLRAPYLSESERGWRGGERVLRELVVKLSVEGAESEARTVNISKTGALLQGASIKATPGTRVQIHFANGGTALSTDAELVWISGDRVGLRFSDVNEAWTTQLQKLLA